MFSIVHLSPSLQNGKIDHKIDFPFEKRILLDKNKIFYTNEHSVCGNDVFLAINADKSLTDIEKVNFQIILQKICSHADRKFYKKMDYLCDSKNNLCIENNYAKMLRKYETMANYNIKKNVLNLNHLYILYYNPPEK